MKNCLVCGKEFEPKNNKGVYCSQKCKQKDYRKQVAGFIKKGRGEDTIKPTTQDFDWAKKSIKQYEQAQISRGTKKAVTPQEVTKEPENGEKTLLERFEKERDELAKIKDQSILTKKRYNFVVSQITHLKKKI
jgi:hypothetical protein